MRTKCTLRIPKGQLKKGGHPRETDNKGTQDEETQVLADIYILLQKHSFDKKYVMLQIHFMKLNKIQLKYFKNK